MIKFITLHVFNEYDPEEIYTEYNFNINAIAHYSNMSDISEKYNSSIRTIDGDYLYVKETVDEIKELMSGFIY